MKDLEGSGKMSLVMPVRGEGDAYSNIDISKSTELS